MGITETEVRPSGGILGSENRLRLGSFGLNDELYGMYRPGRPLLPQDQWPEALEAAIRSDRLGFEAVVPVSTWPANSFDTIAFAAAVAQATQQADVFATVDMGIVPPVTAAKQLATIDHVSRGRMGLNAVAGWRELQAAAHGGNLIPHDDRYDSAEEWMSIVRLLWTNPQEDVEVDGRYYQSKIAKGAGRPALLRDGPPIMNAGTSPRALEFVTDHADLAFMHLLGGNAEEETARATIKSIKDAAAAKGREVQMWVSSPIVVADTDAEADEYLAMVEEERRGRRTEEERQDELDRLRSNSQQYNAFDDEAWKAMLAKPYSTYGGRALGLHGSPTKVVDRLLQLSDWGVDGLLIVWPDHERDITAFESQLLPLLTQAGLRTG